MHPPSIFIDFHNADAQGRVRLNCVGTIRNLAEQRVTLVEGMPLVLTDDDELEADGCAHFSEEERCWVAVIDWQAIRPFSSPPLKESGEPWVAITSASPVP